MADRDRDRDREREEGEQIRRMRMQLEMYQAAAAEQRRLYEALSMPGGPGRPGLQLPRYEPYIVGGSARGLRAGRSPPVEVEPTASSSVSALSQQSTQAALSTLSSNLQVFLESGELADFTIRCGSSEFKVHELILSIRSPVFKAMFQHGTMEKEKREVVIDDIEPDTFQKLLEYIYSANVNLESLEFQKLCHLATAADKYSLTELRDICFDFLTNNIDLKNIGDLAIVARRHLPPGPKRKKVFDFCATNFDQLRQDPEFKKVLVECLDEFFITNESDSGNAKQ